MYTSNKNLHWSMSKQNYYSNRDFSPGYWISSWRPIRSNFNFCLPRFATKVLNLNITHWPKFKFRFFQFQSSQIITSSIYSLQIGKCTCNIFLVMYGLTTYQLNEDLNLQNVQDYRSFNLWLGMMNGIMQKKKEQ